VVYLTGETTAYALSAKDGSILWHYQVSEGVLDYTGPIVANGFVYLESGPLDSNSKVGTFLLSLNAHDGSVHWKQQVNTAPYGEASTEVLANGVLYLITQRVVDGYFSNTLNAFNTGDGSLAWTLDLPQPLARAFGIGISAAP
jgi:outer membrane protein assembly factor BamB